MVVPGANGAIGAAELKTLDELLRPGAVLLLQCEIPFAVVLEAARMAHGGEPQSSSILHPGSLSR